MQGIGETRRMSTSSREKQEERRRGLSSLGENLPNTLAYPFADQLEAWKEDARARSGAKANNTAARRIASRGDFPGHHAGAGSKRDIDSGRENTNNGGYTSLSEAQEKEEEEQVWEGRAWNSGSLLVRPGSEAPSGRVPRMTYIYLVGGNARMEDSVDVEVIVGAEMERTVMSRSSGVTCARVPAREVYTVRNMSGDGKTAVLFWTSPAGGINEDADERPRAAEKEGDEGVEETEQEIPQPLEHLPTAKKSVAAAPIDGMFTRDEEYRRNHCVLV